MVYCGKSWPTVVVVVVVVAHVVVVVVAPSSFRPLGEEWSHGQRHGMSW